MLRCFDFTSLPFLAEDRDAHALASVSVSREYTNAGTSANGQANELHMFILSRRDVNTDFLSKDYSVAEHYFQLCGIQS